MDKNIKTILDGVILNYELGSEIQLKTLDALMGLLADSKQAETEKYLQEQTKTNSQFTNQLAQNALDWLNK